MQVKVETVYSLQVSASKTQLGVGNFLCSAKLFELVVTNYKHLLFSNNVESDCWCPANADYFMWSQDKLYGDIKLQYIFLIIWNQTYKNPNCQSNNLSLYYSLSPKHRRVILKRYIKQDEESFAPMTAMMYFVFMTWSLWRENVPLDTIQPPTMETIKYLGYLKKIDTSKY